MHHIYGSNIIKYEYVFSYNFQHSNIISIVIILIFWYCNLNCKVHTLFFFKEINIQGVNIWCVRYGRC